VNIASTSAPEFRGSPDNSVAPQAIFSPGIAQRADIFFERRDGFRIALFRNYIIL